MHNKINSDDKIKLNKEVSRKHSVTRFISAQTISLFGSSIVQYAIIWYITLTTSSGIMLTISTLCGFLPQIVISLFAGVWLDRYNRKVMIMLSDSIIALSTLVLAAAFSSGFKSMGLLFAVLIIRSAGTGIQTPAVNSILPLIAPEEKLMRINGINSMLSSLTMFLAPAVSGAILSAAPFETVLFIDAATAAIGVTITSTVAIKKYVKIESSDSFQISGKSVIGELKRGFLYLKENPYIKRILLFQMIILFLISPSAFLTPLMVSRRFGSEVWRLSASEMTYSFGMILGGLVIASWGGFKKKVNTALLAGAIYGLLMTGLGCAPIFIFYLICNTMIGVTSPCYNTPITVTIQENVPLQMQGRVFSFMQIATSCALPLGMTVFGPLADIIPIPYILTGAGIVVIMISFFIWKRKFL